jgi:hypothetical protein
LTLAQGGAKRCPGAGAAERRAEAAYDQFAAGYAADNEANAFNIMS